MHTLSRPVIDSHVHVIDPAKFPYASDAWYKPIGAEMGTADNLHQVLDAHGIGKALLVGPNSGYNFDNRCMLDAIAHSNGRFKGVTLVRNDTSLGELQGLQAQGVIGVAMNVALLGVDFYSDIAPLLKHLRDLDMFAQMRVQHDQLLPLRDMLVDSGAKLMFCRALGVGEYGQSVCEVVEFEQMLVTTTPLPRCLEVCPRAH